MLQSLSTLPASVKFQLEVCAVGGALAGLAHTFWGYLPTIAAVSASVTAAAWYSVQLYYFFKSQRSK